MPLNYKRSTPSRTAITSMQHRKDPHGNKDPQFIRLAVAPSKCNVIYDGNLLH
uniref:Uncharacterized protein n=1 Tax=Anguilla anguilla TaxID=7936 RepID=A0A0E9RK91_ANGAN